jgi:NADPH:quinone reductase-like Zn-dependent oxidoreductase
MPHFQYWSDGHGCNNTRILKRTLLTTTALALAALLLGTAGMAAHAAPLTIVIFGGTGNIGQRIVAEALRRGASVTVVVRDTAAASLAPDPKLTLVKGDVLDAAADARLIKGATAVVCAVSFRRPPDPSAYPKAAARCWGKRTRWITCAPSGMHPGPTSARPAASSPARAPAHSGWALTG